MTQLDFFPEELQFCHSCRQYVTEICSDLNECKVYYGSDEDFSILPEEKS